MREAGFNLNSSRKSAYFPRGKSRRKTEDKVTVGLYLPKNLVEKAKKQGLNLSKILEEALSSILSYVEAQNTETTPKTSSEFLGEASFPKEGSVPRAGFEPATTRSSASPQAAHGGRVERSPRLSYLGTVFHALWMTSVFFGCLGVFGC